MDGSKESSRERSPNYPAYALPAAIEFVRRVYDAEKISAVPPVVVGQALSGNQGSGLSGPSRSKIASLRQYGLLDEPGKGRLRVSDTALAIIQKPSPQQYALAIAEAASAPPLFRELRDDHAEASDSALRYFLMTDRGFTEDGANRVLKSYRETVGFANLESSSYGRETEPQTFSESNRENVNKHCTFEPRLPSGRSVSSQQLNEGVQQVDYSWPLPDKVVAQVSLLGKPTRRAIERLITFLEYMRDDLDDVPSPSQENDPTTGA